MCALIPVVLEGFSYNTHQYNDKPSWWWAWQEEGRSALKSPCALLMMLGEPVLHYEDIRRKRNWLGMASISWETGISAPVKVFMNSR